MTYKQYVHKVAEEMAADNIGERDLTQYETKEDWISLYTPPARIAVRLQAEAFKDGYMIGGSLEGVLQSLLIERGLIPEPEVKTFYCGGNEITDNGRCTNQCGICANLPENKLPDHGTHH